ncbi:LysR family transcriptional regulator [Parasutterella secunda]
MICILTLIILKLDFKIFNMSISSHLIDLDGLKVFLVFSSRKSMKKTAEHFGLTVSAVSQIITNLEKQLGVQLFNRKVRPLELTLAGRMLLNDGEILLRNAYRLTDTLRTSNLENIHLKIGFSESISHSLSPLLCGSLFNTVKNFSVQTAMTQTLKEKLESRQLDILISPESFDNEQSFFRRALWSERYLLVLPKNEKPVTQLKELRNLAQRLAYIRYNVDSTDRVQSERIFRKLNIEQTESIGVESSFTMVGLVAQGLGWALMPALGIWQGRHWTREIQVLPIPTVNIERTQWIVTPSKGFEMIVNQMHQLSLKFLDSHIKPWLDLTYSGLSEHIRSISDS